MGGQPAPRLSAELLVVAGRVLWRGLSVLGIVMVELVCPRFEVVDRSPCNTVRMNIWWESNNSVCAEVKHFKRQQSPMKMLYRRRLKEYTDISDWWESSMEEGTQDWGGPDATITYPRSPSALPAREDAPPAHRRPSSLLAPELRIDGGKEKKFAHLVTTGIELAQGCQRLAEGVDVRRKIEGGRRGQYFLWTAAAPRAGSLPSRK